MDEVLKAFGFPMSPLDSFLSSDDKGVLFSLFTIFILNLIISCYLLDLKKFKLPLIMRIEMQGGYHLHSGEGVQAEISEV